MIAAFGTWGGWAALTAVGTVGAVVVALYLGPVQARLKRPDLRLERGVVRIHNREPQAPGSASLAVATLRLSNRRGRNTATNVEVVLQAVMLNGHPIPLIIAPLMWSQSGSAHLDVGPGDVFDVCLLRVTRMGEEGKRRAAIYYDDVNANAAYFMPPSAEPDQLPAGEYAFRLSVRARNLDARIWTVSARFDGCWGDDVDDVQHHLIVDSPALVR